MCEFHCLFSSFEYGNTQREPGNAGLAWMTVWRVWPGLLTGGSFSAVFIPLPQTARLQLYLLCVDCFLRTARPSAEQVPLCNLSLLHSLLLSCKSHAKLSAATVCSQADQRKRKVFFKWVTLFYAWCLWTGGEFGQSNQMAPAS